MPWPQRLNDDGGHTVPNGSNDIKLPMTMTDYTQLRIFIFYRVLLFVSDNLPGHLASHLRVTQ